MEQKYLFDVIALYFNDNYAKQTTNKLLKYEKTTWYSLVYCFYYVELTDEDYQKLLELYKKHKLFYNSFKEIKNGITYSIFTFTADENRRKWITLLELRMNDALPKKVQNHILNFKFKANEKD